MEHRKKRILYWSDTANALTGFGQVSLRLLTSWYKSGKYDIMHLCGCIGDGDINFQRYPWKCRGAIPQNQQIIQRMNQDPNYGRAVSYGLEMLEPMVLEFKPDVIFCVQDPWGSSDIAIQKKFWNQTNCIAWETLDSTPLHQSTVDNIKKFKTYYVWSSFAEEEFNRLGHKNVKTQFPPVDTNVYKPLGEKRKIELKKYFKIEDKKFIVNYVFRNQLRKRSDMIIEGYSILQKENPEIAKDVWLHFHTHHREGWNHKKFCDQYGIDYNKILYTWICKECKELQIKSDNGNCNCPHCGKENTQDTCNVTFGATSEQMNWIYNVANCTTIVANSGATEIPAIEALASGIPLATINYSYGCDFIKQNFVFDLGYTKYVEFGTQFIKANPNPRGIAKFIKKIHNSKPEEIKKISESGRKWIVENFDTEVVSKKWQEVIDNLPEVTWDFIYKPDIKDPNAPMENIEDDFEFVVTAYERILKMMDMRDRNKPETAHWINFLKQPKDKNQLKNELINTFRGIAAQKNAEANPITLEQLLNKDDKRRVGIIIPESIGDIYLTTSLLKSLRERYPCPDWTLYFITNPQFFEILDMNENIDKLIPYNQAFDNLLAMEGQGSHKGFFDIIYPIHFATQRLLSWTHNALDKHDLNFNKICT